MKNIGEKNHLGGHILYRSLDFKKNGVYDVVFKEDSEVFAY